jgi:type VI protein secretion system component Hcp
MDTTTQIYLEITPERGSVIGETRAGGYEQRIDLDSFSFNAKAKINTLGDVTAKSVKHNVDLKRVTLTKVFDDSSLQLAGMLKGRQSKGTEREGDRFSLAKIAVDQQYVESYSTDESAKYANEVLIFNLFDGYVASISFRTSESGAGAQILETIELSFHDFEIVYYAEDRSEAGALRDTWRPVRLSYLTTNRGDQGA